MELAEGRLLQKLGLGPSSAKTSSQPLGFVVECSPIGVALIRSRKYGALRSLRCWPTFFDFDDLGQQPCCDAVRFAQKGATSRKLSIGYLRDLSARYSDVAAVLRRAGLESCRIEPSQMSMTTDASATSYMMLGVLPGASRSIWWIVSIAVIISIFATMRKLTSSALRDPWLAGGGGKTLFTEGE